MGNNLYWYDKDGTEWLIEYMDDYYLAEYNERCEDSRNRSLLPYRKWVNANTDIKEN